MRSTTVLFIRFLQLFKQSTNGCYGGRVVEPKPIAVPEQARLFFTPPA